MRSDAIAGPLTGQKLVVLPSVITSWKEWRNEHPETLVLSAETGHDRNYGDDPYQDVGFGRVVVAGVVLDGQAKAYPFPELRKAGRLVRDELAGQTLVIEFDPSSQSVRVRNEAGREVPHYVTYQDAWESFYPHTKVFKGSRRQDR